MSTEVSHIGSFTHEQIKKINKEIKKNIVRKEDEDEPASNASKIGEFFQIKCAPLMELLHPWLHNCQQANRNVFGYDIYWDFHLEKLNYNVYGTGGEYGWHIDANTGNSPLDMKLTCMLNLSEEPYKGGEFYMINGGEESFPAGDGIIFNSLIAHKVSPVTKGERITLTYWAFGPPWR